VAHDLRISVLGGFEAVIDDRPVADDAWRRNRARTLVKLLALANAQRLHREQLMDALWPTLEPEAAAGNLRKAVHFARQALGPEHVRYRGDLIALEAPTLWVDVEAFERAAQAGRRGEALALYRGDLLPEDRFEPWTEDPRERLRVRFHALLLDEAASLEEAGRLEPAADLLERLVASDPLHEEAHLALIRVLATAGSRHVALARFRQLQDRLRDELGVEASASIRSLVDEIASGRFPAEVDPAPEPGQATKASGDAARALVGDERRLITVLSAVATFDDGDPEVGRHELAGWMASARAIVDECGGISEPQPGGHLLAGFGLPIAHEDDVTRALRCALALMQLMPSRSRVGISTGDVVVAAGSDPPLRRISGTTVGMAASLREAASAGWILIDDRVARASAGFRVSGGTTVPVGGDPTMVRRLLDETPAEARLTPPEAPLIGRDAELAVVMGLCQEAVATARPRLIEIGGPAGVGKTRLAREVIGAFVEAWPGATVLHGRCLAGNRGGTFGPLGEILREACAIRIGHTAQQAQQRLREGLARLLGAIDPADIAPTTYALATTAGISLDGNPLEHQPAAAVQDQLAVAWPILAGACATAGPTLFVVEDLHWAQPALLDLIEHILTRSRGPLVLLVTARPDLHDRRPAFGLGGDHTSVVGLRSLGDTHSGALLDALLAGDAVEPHVRSDILARAEGNPLFLEQLTHHLRDGGPAHLPDTLQSLLTARLDALTIAERRVLQEAAVIGRTFWEEPIRAALPDERVPARLAALERKGFVVRRPTSSLAGQAEFVICHALIHDVAYASLSRARRARAHGAVGSWLEALAGDRVEEVVDLLAHHFWSALSPSVPELVPADGLDRAGLRAKAYAYTTRAGDAARRRFLTDRAIAYHEMARSVAVGTDEQINVLEALAQDHEADFHGDDAETSYREALTLARADPRCSPDVARLCRRLAWMMAWNPGGFRSSPDAVAAEALVDEGVAVAHEEYERGWLLLARGACARLYRGSEPLGQGRRTDPWPIGERIAAAEQARAIAHELGREDLGAAAGQALGMLYGLAGNYADMIDLARREVDELRPEQSRLDQSDAIRKLAIHVINIRADFGQGLELGSRCRNLLGEAAANHPHQLMHTLWPILTSLFHLGRWEELLNPLDDHIAAFRKEPATECQAVRDGPAIGAATMTLIGRPDEARRLADLLGDPLLDRDSASAWQARFATISGDPQTARVISSDKALEGRVYGPQHAFTLLEALAELADWEAAAGVLPAARQTIAGNALLAPMCDRVDGQIKLAQGDAVRAGPSLRRAVRGFRRLMVPLEQARALELLAQALPAREAARTRAAAFDIYARLGADRSGWIAEALPGGNGNGMAVG
jgi:DNA-binding SARP family transcriptional activator